MEFHMGSLSAPAKISAGLELVRLVRHHMPENTAANLLSDQVEERALELRAVLDTPSEQDLYMRELEETQRARDNAYRAMIMVLQAHILCPGSEEDRADAEHVMQKFHPIDFIVGSLLSDYSVLYHRLVWLHEDAQLKVLRKFHLMDFLGRLEKLQGDFDTLLDKRVSTRESQGVSLLRASRPLDRSVQTLLAFVKETCEPECFQKILAPLLEAQQMTFVETSDPDNPIPLY